MQEDIAKLLRYESSALPAGQLTSLTDYSSRMKAGSRNIYYLCAPNRHLAEHSPYFEAMKKKDMEVGEQWCHSPGNILSCCSSGRGWLSELSRAVRPVMESCQHSAFAWPPLPLLKLWHEVRRDLSHTLNHNVKKKNSAVRGGP